MMEKHLTVDLIVDVICGVGDESDRAVLADLLEDAGRSEEAALVRSRRPIKPHWDDVDDYAGVRVVEGQWRPEEKAAGGDEGGLFDLFSDEA